MTPLRVHVRMKDEKNYTLTSAVRSPVFGTSLCFARIKVVSVTIKADG